MLNHIINSARVIGRNIADNAPRIVEIATKTSEAYLNREMAGEFRNFKIKMIALTVFTTTTGIAVAVFNQHQVKKDTQMPVLPLIATSVFAILLAYASNRMENYCSS